MRLAAVEFLRSGAIGWLEQVCEAITERVGGFVRGGCDSAKSPQTIVDRAIAVAASTRWSMLPNHRVRLGDGASTKAGADARSTSAAPFRPGHWPSGAGRRQRLDVAGVRAFPGSCQP